MSTVAAPADRRFRRAHVKPSRRRHDWRRIAAPLARYAAVSLLVAYAVYRGGGLVASAHVLQVSRIVVHGNQRLSTADVTTALAGLRGENVLWLDLDGWRQRLLDCPWVADASLRRSLPATVDVTLSERRPMGIARQRGDMFLVDDEGVLIDHYGPQYADLDLPIVDGLPAAKPGEVTDNARAALAARVIAAIHGAPALGKRLSQIDVADVHDASVILDGDTAVIRLGDDQFLPRLQSYLQLSAALRERVPDIDYVDLRFDDRVYVRPAGKAAKQRSADAGAARVAERASKSRSGRKHR